jgi:predicted amidohydrolase
MKVVAIQFKPQFKDRKSNLRSLVNLIEKAGKEGAKIIVLPELATTGYSIMSEEEAEGLAEGVTNFSPLAIINLNPLSSMEAFYILASKLNCYIIWGLIEKDQGTKKLHNTQVMMCPDGTYEFIRKINRFGNDFLWSTPGRANPPIRKVVIDGKEYKIGLLLCRDIRDKKDDVWDSFYEKGEADIIALSTNWGRGAFPATTWMDFVEEHKVTLIVSNRYGKEANNDFGDGGVCIISPDLKVQCQGLVWNQDCIVTGETQ